MMRLRFGFDDLTQVRFTSSPFWEAVISLRTLAAGSTTGLHAPWLAAVRPRLGEVEDLDLLTTVVRPIGYIPDFLHPNAKQQALSFDAGLAMVATADPDLVAAELSHLSRHQVAMEGPGRSRRRAVLDELVTRPRSALDRILAALNSYWRVAVEPYWPRMRTLLDDDLNHRLRELADGGVRQLFRTLHPYVSFDGDTLSVVKYCDTTYDLQRSGLLVSPCVFAWPEVIVRTADEAGICYSPRGLGRLWESRATGRNRSPLVDVLGGSRTAILTQLDLPMSTTHLAYQLKLTTPTVNVHLKALERAGIVTSHRHGRDVLYHRTPVGEQLIAAASLGAA
jgi:DNA-binding transcriptional ArsR family regulator